jgi:organic hydroperoxide reductase OsmC/OhrA
MENPRYQVAVTWMHEREGWADAPGVREALKFSAPPEFGGRPGFWSPEQLLTVAASSCFLTTLLYFADQKGLTVVSYRDEGEARLEKLPGKGYRFAEVVLRPLLVVEKESDIPLAQRLLEKAEQVCIVTRSLKTLVRVEPRVEVVLPALNG